MSLDDQNRLRCITQTQKILKNQSSYLTLLDGISPQCIDDLLIHMLTTTANSADMAVSNCAC